MMILSFEESGCGGLPKAQDTIAGGLLTTLQLNTALSPEDISTAGREGEKDGRPCTVSVPVALLETIWPWASMAEHWYVPASK